MVVGLRENIYF